MYESAFSFTYAKDVSNSSSMPTSTQFGGAKPPTPPTAQEDMDDLSAFELPAFGSANGNPFANSQLFPAASSAPFALPSSLATGSGLDESLFLNSLSAPSPSSTTGDSTSGSSANLGTPPDLSNDLFSAYRDSSTFGPGAGDGSVTAFPDFDTLFGPTAGEEPNYSAFLASPSPSAPSYAPPQKPSPPTTTSTPACGGEKFSFDVDGLCSE